MTRDAHKPSTAPRHTFARALGLGAALALFAGAGSAEAGTRIPARNLTHNPSFTNHMAGWSAYQSTLRRVRSRNAPDGSFAAKVSRRGNASSYTIDGSNPPAVDAQGNAPSIQGAVYQASAWVKGTAATAHRTVGLVVRETNPSGGLVSDKESQIKLSPRRFKRVTLSYKAAADGDSIDVYVRRADALVNNDAFSVDAVSLILVSKPQVNPPPVDPPPVDPPPVDPPPVDPPPVTPPPTGPVTTSQIAQVNSEEDALWAEQGSNYRYIIIRDSMHAEIPALRAANPDAKILVYKNLAFLNRQPSGCPWSPYQGSGVPWCDATAHESWFLHDTSGNRLESDYQDVFAANVANAGYQQAWINDVEARLTDVNADGSGARYDGVFIDDTNLFPGHGLNGRIQELSDPQYGQAVKGFIQTVGDQLKADGFITMPNLGLQTWDSTQRSQALDIAHHVTAINRETFIRWGEGDLFTTPPSNGTPDWRDELKLESDIQATGADYSAIVYGAPDDVQAQRYARATFLLGWNGQDGSTLIYRPDGSGNSFLPGWTTDVGRPTGDRFAVGSGFRRDFTGGTVIVNPAPTGSQTFNLGGSFRLPDGSCANSATLSAVKALVLPTC